MKTTLAITNIVLRLTAGAAALSSCSSEPSAPATPPAGAGTGGVAPIAGGTGGAPPVTAGTGGDGSGGTNAGTGGMGAVGGDGAGGAAGGTPPIGGAGGAGGGAGGNPAACDYTPTAMAASLPLEFDEMDVSFPTTPSGKTNNGVNGLTQIAPIPGTADEYLVLQKGGNVQHISLSPDSTTATTIRAYDVDNVNATQDCGLLAVAFDPGFEENNLLYFSHCDTPDSTVVSRYTLMGEAITDRQEIHTWDRASGTPSWHTIGSMGFDAEGNMWVLHGEFTGGNISQSDDSDLGKILKIVPNRMAGQGGSVPAAGVTNGRYAKGLRSAWRGFMNSHGHIVFADVGNNSNEEINVSTGIGQNFGWNGQESSAGNCNAPCISPVSFWHAGGNDNAYRADGNPVTGGRAGRAVWLGTEYGNCGNDRYNGSMTGVTTFGDFFTGWARGMVLGADGQIADVDEHLGHLTTVSSWAQGHDGYLYVTTFGGPYDSANTGSDISGLFRAVLAE